MNITPLFDQVLVRPLRDSDEVTASGILLPAQKKVSPTHAEVMAVGKDVIPAIKPGLHIVFMKFQGEPVVVDGENCLIMKQEAILSIVQNGGEQ